MRRTPSSNTEQPWALFNPIAKQCQRICHERVAPETYRVEVPVVGSSLVGPDFWEKLVTYDGYDTPLGNTDRLFALAGIQTSCRNFKMSTLPAEILWPICDRLDADDILALGQTCKEMFVQCCSVIARDIRMTSGEWAKHPLAVVSGNLPYLPETFSANHLAYRSVEGGDPALISLVRKRSPYSLARIYMWAARSPYKILESYEVFKQKSEADYIDRMSFTYNLRPPKNPTSPDDMLSTVLGRKHQNCVFDDPQRGALFYLRNHTNHTLLHICNCHCSHIGSHMKECSTYTPSQLSTYYSPTFSLQAILIMSIRCNDPALHLLTSNQTARRGPWTTGPWAGHKFDIVSAERHEREYPGHSSISSPTWRDVSSAMSTRAAWEYERLKAFDRINRVGPLAKNGSGKGLRGKGAWAFEARKKIKSSWIAHMDGMYPYVMSLFDRVGDDETGNALMLQWRSRLEEIIKEHEDKMDPDKRKKVVKGVGVRKKTLTDKRSGKRKPMGDKKSQRWRTVDVRRSERLNKAITAVSTT